MNKYCAYKRTWVVPNGDKFILFFVFYKQIVPPGHKNLSHYIAYMSRRDYLFVENTIKAAMPHWGYPSVI